mmetsp:Transcript_2060/g.2928  ORF Transcript_2060/g.2928 Transcript_2060/m.2928 type:complete len:100 (+) Transcript_2060:592-891(+)
MLNALRLLNAKPTRPSIGVSTKIPSLVETSNSLSIYKKMIDQVQRPFADKIQGNAAKMAHLRPVESQHRLRVRSKFPSNLSEFVTTTTRVLGQIIICSS